MRNWLLFAAAALLPIGLAVVSPSAAQAPARSCSQPVRTLEAPVAKGGFCPAPPLR